MESVSFLRQVLGRDIKPTAGMRVKLTDAGKVYNRLYDQKHQTHLFDDGLGTIVGNGRSEYLGLVSKRIKMLTSDFLHRSHLTAAHRRSMYVGILGTSQRSTTLSLSTMRATMGFTILPLRSNRSGAFHQWKREE